MDKLLSEQNIAMVGEKDIHGNKHVVLLLDDINLVMTLGEAIGLSEDIAGMVKALSKKDNVTVLHEAPSG